MWHVSRQPIFVLLSSSLQQTYSSTCLAIHHLGEKCCLCFFLPLTKLMCEIGSLALLVYCISSGRGAQCTVSSGRRSCCPGCASCCGGLEVKRCGRDQQRDDMGDQMTEPFSSHNDDAQSCVVKLLNQKHICDLFL